jgi:hypothetical protein
VSISGTDATGVFVSQGGAWLQEAEASLKLDEQLLGAGTAGVRLVGGVWEQKASIAIDLSCPPLQHQSAVCEGTILH